MPKTIKEFQLNQSTGEVSVEYSDDSTSKFNAADMVTAQTDPVTGVISLSAGHYQTVEKLLRCMKSPFDPYATVSATITVGSANASTVIAGSILIEPDDARIWPSRPAVRGTGWPGPLFTYQKHTDYAATGAAPELACNMAKNSFSTDADDFEVVCLAQGSEWVVWVDGKRAGAFILAATGNVHLVRVQLAGGNKMREICIESSAAFGGIRQSPTRSFASPMRERLCVMVIGDSITEGSAALHATRAYAGRLHGLLGATHGGSDGVGGTGYVSNLNGTRKSIPERLQQGVISENPDVCIWAAGINDSASSQEAIAAALSDCLSRVKAANPNVLNIVFGPFQPRSLSILGPTNATIKAAAQAAGAMYIDNIAQKELTGTGKVGSAAGDGNSDWAISADGTHPTDDGHAYIADWRKAAILRALSA